LVRSRGWDRPRPDDFLRFFSEIYPSIKRGFSDQNFHGCRTTGRAGTMSGVSYVFGRRRHLSWSIRRELSLLLANAPKLQLRAHSVNHDLPAADAEEARRIDPPTRTVTSRGANSHDDCAPCLHWRREKITPRCRARPRDLTVTAGGGRRLPGGILRHAAFCHQIVRRRCSEGSWRTPPPATPLQFQHAYELLKFPKNVRQQCVSKSETGFVRAFATTSSETLRRGRANQQTRRCFFFFFFFFFRRADVAARDSPRS